MKAWKKLYGVLFFAMCLVPSAGLLPAALTGSGDGEGNSHEALSDLPALFSEDGSLRDTYFEELGDYFQEHFAYRDRFVTADALLMSKVFGTSAADGVIVGTDGWLYYKDSLEDYQRTNPMSDRELFNVAHSLAMMQTYLEEKGCTFAFTVAPNKNSLYGENMPYYTRVQTDNEKNIDRLQLYLTQEGVNYIDLFSAFENEEEILYHKRDSHWNNKGAAMAADQLLDTLGKEHTSFADTDYEIRTDFSGDLDEMLYPSAVTPEDEIYYTTEFQYTYLNEIESTFDTRIYTANAAASGALVMYRDSFGNAILPFLAEAYGTAYFSRGIPYQLSDVDTMLADTLIVERAERFLTEMAASPPVMPAPEAELSEDAVPLTADSVSGVTSGTWGTYTKLGGTIDSSCLDTRSRIFVKLENGTVYEAFPTTSGDGEEGFVLYLEDSQFSGSEEQIQIYITKES